MTAPAILIEIVELITGMITPPENGAAAPPEEAALTAAAAPYENVLYFLWACHKHPDDMSSPIIQPIIDKKVRVNINI